MNDKNSLKTIDPDAGVTELEADIRRTRQELGDTVEALSTKLDVKSHIKSSTDQAKANAVDAVTSNWREITLVAVWAVAVTLVWKKL